MNFSSGSYAIGRVLLVRGVGAVFLIAFFSWWTQAIALTGEEGLLPVGDFLDRVRGAGLGFSDAPSLFWWRDGNTAIHAVCGIGVLASLAVVLGWTTGPSLLVAWGCYLSLMTTGGVFMSFQWDILLLESGVVAALAARWCGWRLKLRNPTPIDWGPRIAVWLSWLVVAKLMFLSGWVKLAWATPAQPEWWPEHTAMTFHYFTQPLPTWTAWWMHQLPEGIQKASIWPMYFVELVLPFAVVAGRRGRLTAALGFVGLMLLIAATGNYTYFNGLTIVLSLALVEDRYWRWMRGLVKKRLKMKTGARSNGRAPDSDADETRTGKPRSGAGKGVGFWVRVPLIAVLVLLNAQVLYLDLSQTRERPWLSPWRLTSGYGLFRTMTTTRPEIVIEGSLDGRVWREYELPWKPGALDERPRFVAPHQPRLDWQFWFFALGKRYDARNPNAAWFSALVEKILRGSRDLDRYFSVNPFPENPPKVLRATLYAYEFTTIEERRESGNWWKRREIGRFLPEVRAR